LSSVSVDDTIRPPVIGAGALPITPPRNDSAPPTPSTSPAAESGPSVLEREARAALLLFAAGLLLLALRRVWVLLAWRRVRRRLRRGEPAAAVAGAWIWARRRLRLFGVTFPSALSPDQVAAGGAVDEVSHRVSRPLEDLAGRVTLATFAGGAAPARSQVLEAWQLADLAATGARRAQSPLRRVRVWFRGPSGRGAR
jgi:hypothetical protein